uniref:BPTI/Kunitz inhibitor domain-containing protein n=1 Tax=Bos mutus grunniens TaxID=30521 RepID=A0A8C0AD82_BOSMU
MNRLCLSAALLFLLVILVDSTLVNIHHIQHEGLETSHRRGPKKHSTKDMIKNIIRGVATGANFLQLRGEERLLALYGAVMTVHITDNCPLIPADSRPAFCLEPKVVGHGTTKMPRYFYNAKTGHCEPFTYGSLGGNKNNFLTLEDCMETCGQGAGSLGHAKSVSQKM